MGESHSGYRVPLSQMEDVPIDNHHDENAARSRPQYVKFKGKLTPCIDMTNHWDFFRRYKTSVFTAIISMMALLLFSAAIIYMSLQSADGFSTLPVKQIVEEESVTENQFFTNLDVKDVGRRDNIIRRNLYKIVPETIVKLKKREIRQLQKRDAQLLAHKNVDNDPKNTKSLQEVEIANKALDDVEIMSDDSEFSKEIYEKENDDQRKYDKREIERRQKLNACLKNSERCKAVLESMQSLVRKAGENVDGLSRLVQQIRVNEVNKNPDPQFQDFLQCIECGKMSVNDSIAFVDTDSNDASSFRHQQPPHHHHHHHHHSQMKNMSSISALLDNSSSDSDETAENFRIQDSKSQSGQNSPNNAVTSSITQKSGSDVKKTIVVSKSKKLTDGAEIIQIIKNTTIIKKPDEKLENETQDMSSGSAVQPSTSTTASLNFDSLMPLRPRPTMQVINGVSGPTSSPAIPNMYNSQVPSRWTEGTRTRVMNEELPVMSTVDPTEARFFQGPSGEGESMGPYKPRILPGMQFQSAKGNSDGNPMIPPTAETMKSGQQVQYTPWMPYSVCYFGSPPIGGPSGPFKQTMPGMINFPISSPGAANYPFAGNQYPMRGSGFPNQGFVPMQFQQFGQMPQFQQGNMPSGQQGQRVGPSGLGPQHFMPNFGNPPTGPGASPRTPFYCTYMSAPTYQFPTIPGVSDFQRSADNPTNVVEGSPRQYGMHEAVWGGEASTYPGYPGDCDINAHRCLDGTRCIPKNLWCDGTVDCPDASDETRCSCRDRITKDRICDGYFDCPHGEDELGCFGCPENSFSCEDWSRRYKRDNCVPLSQRCDGLQQCSNGKDEKDCAILTGTYIENHDAVTVGFTSGYLHKNWKGRWYPVCSRTEQWAVDACSAENDSPISEPPLVQIESTPSGQYNGPYLLQSESGEIQLVNTCFDKAIHVVCPEIPCGTRVLSDETYPPYGPYEDTLVANSKIRNVRQGNDRYSGAANGNGEDVLGDSRVVGGRASQPKAWPFLVGIYKDGYFHCGGSIIDDEWVLTAAHCVDEYPHHHYEIQAGLLRRFSFSPMAQIRRARHIKMHPRYNKKIMKNDLALIKLNEPLRFNRWIRPTCLPKSSSHASYWRNGPYPDTTCVTVGWGATAEHGPDPDHLREVEVPILSECKHLVDRNDAEICAGMPQGGRDACQGDSGGPLMCKHPGSENQWYVAGIVSHGDGCARPNEPGAYTKVSKFVDWIENTIGKGEFMAVGQKPVETCPGFSCGGGLGKCLPRSKRCDGIVNCLDAEDEMNCPAYNGYPPFRTASTARNNQESNTPNREMVGQITQRFLETTESDKETNAATSQDPTRNSVFTTNDEENSTMAGKADAIAPWSSATQKNIADATSASVSSTEQPIITTSKPQSSSQQTNEINYVPRFTCTKVLQSILMKKRCDRVLDCEDGTDEDNCTCKDYLANSHPIAICDGHVDCYDGSDEENCALCKEYEFVCSRSGKCISQAKMCDHHIDCPYMEDELDCFALTNGNYVIMDLDKRPHLNLQGVVTQRRNGKWRPACQKHNATVQARLSNEFCVYFGFGAAESIKEITVKDSPIEVRQSTKDNVIPYEYPPTYTEPTDFSKRCLGLYVRCKPILSANTSHLIATNPTNDDISYLLPWQAHIFVNGHYHCPAILLEYSWLLASSRCAEDLDLKDNYTIALLGTAPTYLHVDGPYQQKAAIDSIKVLNKLDAAMMHLEYPVNMTRYVQPIFLQKKIFPATTKDLCVSTGVDDKHHTKTTYLRPVPQNCPQCHRCYTNATSEDCRNNKTSTNWSGTVVCRGSSTWYPAAIFHEKDLLCGFQTSQTLASIDYGYAHFTEVMDKELQPMKRPTCDGLLCPLGKCIPWNKVCDGIDDCRGGTDENEKYCGKRRELCKATNGIGCQCAKSELRCANGQCVPKEAFCNSIFDCDDRSDEPATCNCAAYLKLTAPERLCDNVRHCLDKSDETSESCLCKDASFKCTSRGINVTENCVSQDFVCDGEEDCANGKDERKCRRVKGTLRDPPGTGEVLRRSFGVWHSECFPMPLTTTKEITELCKSMGYDFGTRLELENGEHPYGPPVVAELDEFYMIRLNSNAWLSLRADHPLVTVVPATEPCHRAFVKCT